MAPTYYDASGNPFRLDYNGTAYYYIANLQGDVMYLIEAQGNRIAAYTYDPFGMVLTATGTMAQINPLRYRGYYYDTESELYYLQSRYYDPVTCRFINADSYSSTGQGILGNNMFAYCGNNPILRKDDGGEFWHIVIGAAVGGLMSGVIKGVSNVISGASITDGLATAMLSGAASGALAATGVGLVGMIGGNAAISMAENVSNRVIDNGGFKGFNLTKEDVGDILIDGTIGAINGALGGSGNGSKHLTDLGKQTVKRTSNALYHKGIRAGFHESQKAFSYYAKNTGYYYKPYLHNLKKDLISGVGTAIVSSDFMKSQYHRMGRIWFN